MKNSLFYLGISIPFLFHGTWSHIEPDMKLQRTMSKIQNLTQWCQLVGLQNDECEQMIESDIPTLATDEAGDKVLVSTDKDEIKTAFFDACNVRELTVEMPEHPAVDAVVWPRCTRIKRCGGCTTSKVLSCEPTEVKEIFVRVIDTFLPYPGAQRFELLGTRVVKLLEHLKCEPQCRTKAHHCNEYQRYDGYQCSCICTDEIIELRQPCPDSHVWDASICDCVCLNYYSHYCHEPAYFHEGTCRCTLKTDVIGEIDIDMIYEQLKKGLLDVDGLPPLVEGNKNISGSVSTGESVEPTETENGTDATNNKGADEPAKQTENVTKSGVETGKSPIPLIHRGSSTTTTTTAATTTMSTTTATTTETPVPTQPKTEAPCRKCIPPWVAKMRNGKCFCLPSNVA